MMATLYVANMYGDQAYLIKSNAKWPYNSQWIGNFFSDICKINFDAHAFLYIKTGMEIFF